MSGEGCLACHTGPCVERIAYRDPFEFGDRP